MPEGESIELDRDNVGNSANAFVGVDVRRGGSAKLQVDGKLVAEIRHIPK